MGNVVEISWEEHVEFVFVSGLTNNFPVGARALPFAENADKDIPKLNDN